MARVTIAEASSEQVCELWGEEFEIRLTTRAQQEKIEEALKAYRDKLREAKDGDDVVAAHCILIDARLKPIAPKRRQASAVILEKWKADQLSVGQLEQLTADLAEAADGPPS